ncbi:hypothetical protein AVEN_61189-1 [Araneus ventricosus]|uniref:Acyltransferase 3 domain-containing protein n=1 Tax=Araneus ventricosus TaxID=182803 RepID=A0A4Y2QZ90_ARAVE|nr:hypothetical protein AVEN_61189-1 [Araneus ventricosus]
MGWIISSFLLWLCTFGVIDPQGSAYEIAAFHSIKPLLYGCFFSWVTFACFTGQGGFLNKFLSCKVFKILSRLSYSGYLLHMLVLDKYFLSFEEFIDHSSLSLVLTSIYLLLWIIAISFIFYLIFEKPVLRMFDFFHDIFQKNLHQKTN